MTQTSKSKVKKIFRFGCWKSERKVDWTNRQRLQTHQNRCSEQRATGRWTTLSILQMNHVRIYRHFTFSLSIFGQWTGWVRERNPISNNKFDIKISMTKIEILVSIFRCIAIVAAAAWHTCNVWKSKLCRNKWITVNSWIENAVNVDRVYPSGRPRADAIWDNCWRHNKFDGAAVDVAHSKMRLQFFFLNFFIFSWFFVHVLY